MLTVEPTSSIPIYIQLRNQVMEAIARGELSTGDTLPSVRALAADLGVNMHTVNKSYHELVSKEIIEIVPKKGAVIIANNKENISEERLESLSNELKPLVTEALVHGINEIKLHDLVSKIMKNIKEVE
ncbi:HTH-type transcriptional repressor YtrA [Paraliobacillus ryukyuensis]|uniref:GntR family transcriptional regulator n=1 Tax=Paraliobacillus ryukyuensis TaxID=200904 RepID=A0A366E7F3_9BACI|nr:GntR family transcriptional regulator [Paraliobacillus ryukyuensis]RBO98320.1 GntR family transcriptional regulator [Paraliobacillus ryukyuensis]